MHSAFSLGCSLHALTRSYGIIFHSEGSLPVVTWWDTLSHHASNYIKPSHSQLLASSLFLALSTAILSVNARGIRRSTASERPAFTLSNNPMFFSSAALAIPFVVSVMSQTQSPCVSRQYPYLAANDTIRILARSQSVTGMVLIAENLNGPFRFMRCDHSLLGGRWLVPSDRDKSQFRLSESIYTAFIYQEAVRLVERPKTERVDRALAMYASSHFQEASSNSSRLQ